jgi:hypothetical protein
VNSLRRNLLLVLITIATVIGLTAGTAQAAFDDKAALTPLTVSTLTVAAPTGVNTAGTYCSTAISYVNGVSYSTRTMHATVSWKASSTTRGISGYRVTAWFPDGSSYPVGDVPAGVTTVSMDVDGSYGSQNIRVTVTTLTSYGWTTPSAKSGALTC